MVLNNFEIFMLCAPLFLVLLSIAFLPLLAPKLWHRRQVLILFSIAFASMVISFLTIDTAMEILKHSICSEYIPFIVTLFSLYVLSCGIHINFHGGAGTFANAGFLFVSSIFSSFIGTTGAAMLFLKPYIAMNSERKNKKHLIVFFIFLVANIGGLLTPLGDPPLLIGYIHGVEFSWCMKNLAFAWFVYISLILSVFVFVDKLLLSKEKAQYISSKKKYSIKIDGWLNIIFIFGVVLTLFLKDIMLKNIILLTLCFVSYRNSKKSPYKKINFEPIKEVAVIFAAIFVVIAPVVFVLEMYSDVIQNCIKQLSLRGHESDVYFWLCGLTSSLLDNAPSYLLFFNIAGGDAHALMSDGANILKAISTSAVVMGALTYIGNAPNMMVKSIAEKMHIKMPSFFEYTAWAILIVVPISMLVNFLSHI